MIGASRAKPAAALAGSDPQWSEWPAGDNGLRRRRYSITATQSRSPALPMLHLCRVRSGPGR